MRAPRLAQASRIPAWLERAGRHDSAAALLLYVAVAVVLERQAVAHLGSVCACSASTDPTQFMWAMVWWPYAILHGLNPLVTHFLWTTPGGFNLAAATSTPIAALVAWPITAVAGPIVSYNVLSILAPVVNAWFAYRLCLYVTRSRAASMLGGYLFGFSPYEFGQLLGHLHLIFTFALPAVVLLTLQHLDGVIGTRRYTFLIAVLLIVQLGLSSEMLLTLTCMGAALLVCGYVFASAEDRRRLLGLLPKLGAAYAGMAVLASPWLYEELRGSPFTAGIGMSADALGFVIPTELMRVGGHRFFAVSSAFPGNASEQGTYLGLPLVAMVAAFAIESWRTRAAKIAVAIAGVAIVWSLGARLFVDGHPTILLPWKLLASLPLFDQLLPIRIGAYLSLAAAVMAAYWISAARAHAARRWILAALAVAFVIPNVGLTASGVPLFHAPLRVPRFFTTDLYRRYLHRNETVLPVRYGPNGMSLLWQARAGMYFRMASGHFGYAPPDYLRDPIVGQLLADQPTREAPAELRSFIVRKQIAHVILDATQAGPWPGVLAQLGLRPTPVGGVLLYQIPGGWFG